MKKVVLDKKSHKVDICGFLDVIKRVALFLLIMVIVISFSLNSHAKSAERKYVVLFPQALPFCYMLHAQSGLVGYPGFGIKKTPFYSGNLILKIDPSFKKRMVDVGYPKGVNIETIIGLRPKFVINAAFAKMINDRIKKFGIPVVGVTFGFGGFSQFINSVKAIAKATSHIEDGEEFISYYKHTIKLVRKKLKGCKYRPKVLYLSYEGPKGNKLTSGGRFDTLIDRIITVAGGIDVASDVPGFFGQIDYEDILKWDPEYIIVGSGGSVKFIYQNNKLKYVSAVVKKHVYKLPTDGNGRFSNWYAPEKSSLGILWTAKILHPKLFKGINIKRQASYYYRKFWGINIKSVKISGSFPWK